MRVLTIAKQMLRNYLRNRGVRQRLKKKEQWIAKGQIPWDDGYVIFKEDSIKAAIEDDMLKEGIKCKVLPQKYGIRIDERIVEYPWIISNLKKERCKMLDAGSTFNFHYLLTSDTVALKNLTIFTLCPENQFYNERGVSYHYGDLRDLPFKGEYFDEIICQSTLEHIDMDNSMYGSTPLTTTGLKPQKSFEYLKVIDELIRVLKCRGTLLITFPFGRYENHGFFQQFDGDMLDKIKENMEIKGNLKIDFFQYHSTGWQFADQKACAKAESYNPHTRIGMKEDLAAHSRAVCCIKFIKA